MNTCAWSVMILAATLDIAVAASATPDRAEIRYLAPENAIWVRGFRHQRPATMDDVWAADRTNQWNRVAYDPGTDTYRLDTALWIGGTASWEPTYFQIGRPGHEKETVVVRGNVWVRPPRQSFKRADGRFGLINCLTLGDPANTNIKACLQIACATNRQYGLRVGDQDYELGAVYGGEVRVYNSAITAAEPDSLHRLAGLEWNAAYVELVNAAISWIDGCVADGIQAENYRVHGCRFDHCGAVLAGGSQRVTDCRFENLAEVPIRMPRDVQYIRCAFAGNASNWSLQNLVGIVVEMIDCDIQPAKKPIRLVRNTYPLATLRSWGSLVYPYYIERRSCVVKVLDEKNRPVSGAVVSLRCPGDSFAGHPRFAAVRNPTAVTGPDGKTPARYEDGALLPAVRRLQATDDPAQPREDALAYELTVEAPGRVRLRGPLATGEIGKVQVRYPK